MYVTFYLFLLANHLQQQALQRNKFFPYPHPDPSAEMRTIQGR